MKKSLRSALIIAWLFLCLGCASEDRIGVLTKDVKAGVFGKPGYLITIPKGTTVKEVPSIGPGDFEPYRFEVILTTRDSKLVDYSAAPTNPYEEVYSIDSVQWLTEKKKKKK